MVETVNFMLRLSHQNFLKCRKIKIEKVVCQGVEVGSVSARSSTLADCPDNATPPGHPNGTHNTPAKYQHPWPASGHPLTPSRSVTGASAACPCQTGSMRSVGPMWGGGQVWLLQGPSCLERAPWGV